jgi:GT2 family glycosyltransferase
MPPPPKSLTRLRQHIANLLAGVQFAWNRSGNALSRTSASLRRRGLRNTISRAFLELRGPRTATGATLQIPAGMPFAPFAIPRAAVPVASIVVPAWNHFEHTLTCLRALAASGDATAFEVIVVDDASTDETAARMRDIEGVRCLRNTENLGFIGACNAGAAIARGDYLVFLNNDTAVQSGWLDALVGTFDTHPRAGLVGAKLVYPDGRLQEAGGIVFRDGSGWNYGRFDDPAAPAYGFVREADYCSGAAIALPRALFERLGGFDAHYAPAYYEDTDLAMKVRAEGLQVLYQPASTVVHFEGITSGTDPGSGIKAYQAANQRKFLDRWRDALATHPAPDEDLRRASDHRATRRVLVIDAYTPKPDRDSASLRLVNLLALLREEGCAVTFFADNRAHDGAYTEALQSLGVQAWWKPWIRSAPNWFATHGALFDTIIVSRHYVASNYLDLARRHAPQACFVFDTVDLHYLREQREAEVANDPARIRSVQQTREGELKLVRESDLTLVVSPVEQALLARDAPGAAIEVLSNVHRGRPTRVGFAERRNIVFVGGYRHPPNVDAALWMAREIFPLVRAQRDDIVLHLIGGDVTDAVLALGELPGVRVHGHVPDIDPYMDGCRIGLAPLRYGAGVKGKVNLSMAHGQPVVATPAAIEGMHLRDGEDVLVGADAQAFADAILRLYDDEVLWNTLARHGIENVERHFSFDAAREALRRVLGTTRARNG